MRRSEAVLFSPADAIAAKDFQSVRLISIVEQQHAHLGNSSSLSRPDLQKALQGTFQLDVG
jgi:hypothetical protein